MSSNLVLQTCFRGAFLIALVPCALTADGARADTMRSALSDALINNPRIEAATAELDSKSEGMPIARAGFFPTVSATGSAGVSYSRRSPGDFKHSTPAGLGLEISQPLFDGGMASANMARARASFSIAEANYESTVAEVLVESATIYLDVLSSVKIVRLREQNVRRLDEQLRATRQRFQVGETTRTDVAQAQASRSRALDALSSAQAMLTGQKAQFFSIIGRRPIGNLVDDNVVHSLVPRSLKEAMRLAAQRNLLIKSAELKIALAETDLDSARASALPKVNLSGAASTRWIGTDNIREDSFSLTASLRVPIFAGGADSSLLRARKEQVVGAKLGLDVARRIVDATVTASWATYKSADSRIRFTRDLVRAAGIAFSGVKAEAQVGQRNTLDVLNARQELLDAEVEVIKARRNRLIASIRLLHSIGYLDREHFSH